MSLTLRDTFGLNDACAVDGSFLPATGAAAWAMWRGVGDDGEPDASGGALPSGSTIADAEMTAIDACMQSAEARVWPPRLLVLSDCTAVLLSMESAWATGPNRRGYGLERPSLL